MSGEGERRAGDEVLGALGRAPEGAPPMSEELKAELARAEPVATRRPRRQVAITTSLSLLYAGLLVFFLSLRPNLGALPLAWVIGHAALWLACFVGVVYAATVPASGEVIPRRRRAAIFSAAAIAAVAAAGLGWVPAAPDLSTFDAPSFGALVRHGPTCLARGLAAAIVPAALAVIALRGALPVGSRALGFAIGVAGGSLGGLMLHFTCQIATPLHLGVIHGLMVLAAGLIGALTVPRVAR